MSVLDKILLEPEFEHARIDIEFMRWNEPGWDLKHIGESKTVPGLGDLNVE